MSINPFPEYKAHTFAKNKLIEEFEASKSRAINATSLCAKVREHDATILSTELISLEDLNFFRNTHSEALKKASDMIRTFAQPAYLDTLSLSGALGTIKDLLSLSIENSRNLILPQPVSVDSSSLLSLRIGLPSWSADLRRSNEEKISSWSLQGLPRRSESKDLLDPLFDARTAAFYSFRHYGRSLFDPLFDLNPEPIKTTATFHQDGEMRASLVNQTEKISITRLVSHERILATFKMLIAGDIKLDLLAPLSNDSSAPRSSSSTPSIVHDKSSTSKVDSIMQLAHALLSSPGDLNASALFDSIALSGIESLTPAFLGVEEHFEEMVKSFFKTELTQEDLKLEGRKIDTDKPDLFKHYLQSNLVYYLKTYEKNSYEGINSFLESAMKNERRLWEDIRFCNDEKKGAEVDLSLQMVALGFEWFKEDVEPGIIFPFVCQYPSLVGNTNVLGSCIGSLHAHSCSGNDPSVFAGALSFLSSQNDIFNERERERKVPEENASAIDVAALKAINRITSIPVATKLSALSFASSWKGPSSKVTESNLLPAPTEALSMTRRLLRLSAILCAYNDQLDEEAVFVSKLRSKVNKNFDLSPMLAAIRCFSDKESPTMQEGIWDARFRMEMNKDLKSLKSLSTLGTLTPEQLKEQDTVFRSLLTELVPETLNQKLEWKFKTLLFGSQRVVNEGIASLIIHGVLQRLMNQPVNETSTRRVTSSLNVFFSEAASIALSPRSNLTTGPDRRNIDSFLERCRNFRLQSMKTYVVSPPLLPSDTHLIHLESMQAVSSPTGGSPGRKMMTISESPPPLPSSPPPPPLSPSRLSLSSSPSRLSSSSPPPFTTSSALVCQVSGSTPSPPPQQQQLLPPPLGSSPSSMCAVCKKPGILRCTQCLVALFCGKECQGIAWKEHKKYCKKASKVIPTSAEIVQSLLLAAKENAGLLKKE